MKIFVCGQREFGAAALRMVLEEGHEVLGVCSPPFSSRNDAADRLRAEANRHSIAWICAEGLNAESMPEGADLIVAAHAHNFIGRKTRHKARLGALGYHPSLLPRHRGRDAIRWALHMGDPLTGGTAYWLSDGMDCGPIAAQEWCWILPGDDAAELWRRELFPMGIRLLRQTLRAAARGVLVRIPQDPAAATFEPSFEAPRRYRPDLDALPPPGQRQPVTVISSRESARGELSPDELYAPMFSEDQH